MRKLWMAGVLAAAALLAQGARADDAAKERREAVDATKEQVKQEGREAKAETKEGAEHTREWTKTQANKADRKMDETRADMKRDSSDRTAAAGQEKKHPLFEGKDNFKVEGKIQRVSSDSITLAREELPAAKLRISKDTKVELDGQQVSAAQLKQGQDVKASFNLKDDKPEAVEIKAEKANK